MLHKRPAASLLTNMEVALLLRSVELLLMQTAESIESLTRKTIMIAERKKIFGEIAGMNRDMCVVTAELIKVLEDRA